MAVYSKGIIDRKINQINTTITETSQFLQYDYNAKINTEINNRRDDIIKILNGGTTEEGDIIVTGLDQVLTTLYGPDKKPDSEEEAGNTNILQQIIQNLPAPGSSPMSPNQIVVTNSQGKITNSGVTIATLNILNTLSSLTNVNLANALNNMLNKVQTITTGAIAVDTIPTEILPTTGEDGWYYLTSNSAKNSVYIYRYNVTATSTRKIFNPVDVSVDFDFKSARAAYDTADDNLVNSINNYGNLIGVDWKINDSNTYGKNLIIDTYFYNRNQDNRWFEFTANNIYLKFGITCNEGLQ